MRVDFPVLDTLYLGMMQWHVGECSLNAEGMRALVKAKWCRFSAMTLSTLLMIQIGIKSD